MWFKLRMDGLGGYMATLRMRCAADPHHPHRRPTLHSTMVMNMIRRMGFDSLGEMAASA